MDTRKAIGRRCLAWIVLLGFRMVEQFATSLPVPGHLASAIGRPLSGLHSPGLEHRIASFLGLRSMVSLQPARELFCLLL